MGTLYDLLKGTNIPGAGNRFWNWASKVSEAVDTGGGGGSGCSAIQIPDGETLSGIYDCNVTCQGSVSLAGPVTVQGSLLVLGDITNSEGHSLSVSGDFFAQTLDFTKTDTGTPQADVFVGGDFSFIHFEFPQCGGTAATLTVGGNLIARPSPDYVPWSTPYKASLNGQAVTDFTSGLAVLVSGDLIASFIDVTGGNGGNGGSVKVLGSLTILRSDDYDSPTGIHADGGDAYSIDALIVDSGKGGSIYVGGDVSGTEFSINGGFSYSGNGADGGSFECGGSLSIWSIYANGGGCDSADPTFGTGSGGSITVGGDAVFTDLWSAGGGYRTGAVVTPGFPTSVGCGGTLDVRGTLNGYYFAAGGTESDATFLVPTVVGGDGGTLTVGGYFVGGYLLLLGGNVSYGEAGNGGSLSIKGDASVFNLECFGGSANGGSGGNGAGDPSDPMLIGGNAYLLGEIFVYGGESVQGNSGSGGHLKVLGHLVGGYMEFSGGPCGSDDSSHIAGKGGTLTCYGFTLPRGVVNVGGGNRTGATAIVASNPSPDAGKLFVYGDVSFTTQVEYAFIKARGGDISTNVANGPGGKGGEILITGDISSDAYATHYSCDASGGDAVDDVGGQGGSLSCQGFASLKKVDLRGGNGTGGSGSRGSAGSAYFYGGVSCNEILQLDGSGTGAFPATIVELVLCGYCSFYSINIQDRGPGDTSVRIRGEASAPAASLKVLSMPSLSKLYRLGSTSLTGSVSGSLQNSFFVTGNQGGDLGWYTVTGAWT